MGSWFSGFGKFGVLRFGGGPNQIEKVYNQLTSAYGPGFTGGNVEAEIFAEAVCLGIASAELESAANQSNPLKATYTLAAQEFDYGIVPAPNATLQDRRAALAAAQLLPYGARLDAMVAGLQGVLGSAYVGYKTFMTDDPAVPAPFPPIGHWEQNFKSQKTLISVVKITEPIRGNGTQTVHYTWFCGDKSSLGANDTIMVEPGRGGLQEMVTVDAATSSASFTAEFTIPHDPGTFVTTAPWPFWRSYQRSVLVFVSAATLDNAVLLRAVHRFMRRWSRGVTLWSIVSETSPGSGVAGPFKVGSRIGQCPIVAVTL